MEEPLGSYERTGVLFFLFTDFSRFFFCHHFLAKITFSDGGGVDVFQSFHPQ